MKALSEVFFVHRSYSWLLLIGSGWIYFYIYKKKIIMSLKRPLHFFYWTGFVLTAIVGLLMTRFDFPIWTQPIHLMLASGIFSALFYLILTT